MPSTENTTLNRIQREISDVLEREKELRHSYEQANGNINNNNNNEHETNNNISPTTPVKPVLSHSVSTGAINGTKSTNGIRLFTPNTSTRGVMHKFIKSRGKLTSVTGFQPSSLQVQQQQTPSPPPRTWIIPDVIEPPKVTESEKCIRKGYVPVQVRMQKELEDLHRREMELRSVRRKSQPDYSDDDLEENTPHLETTLKAARSMAQLYDPNEYRNDDNISPAGLKPARSLADLCDASEDELETPGSHSLIMRWEQMIQKNQQENS